MTSKGSRSEAISSEGDHLARAALKRASSTDGRIPGKYVVEARRRVPGVEVAWAEAEWTLPGNPRSIFGHRDEAEQALLLLERDHPHVMSRAYEVRLRIARRAPGDEAADPLPAPAPPPPRPPKAPDGKLGTPDAPQVSELIRAAAGIRPQE